MSKHAAINTFGRSANPAFTKNFGNTYGDIPVAERMTLDGAVNKTGILLSLCFGGAFIGWNIPQLMFPAMLIGFVLANLFYSVYSNFFHLFWSVLVHLLILISFDSF